MPIGILMIVVCQFLLSLGSEPFITSVRVSTIGIFAAFVGIKVVLSSVPHLVSAVLSWIFLCNKLLLIVSIMVGRASFLPRWPFLILWAIVRWLVLRGRMVVFLLAIVWVIDLLVCEVVANATPSIEMIFMLLVHLAEVLLIVVCFLALYFVPPLLATVVALAVPRAEIVLFWFFHVEVGFLCKL